MVVLMESAEIDQDDLREDIILSPDNRIKVKLHLESISLIKENNKEFKGFYKSKLDDGTIFHFKIKGNEIELQIIWNTFPPHVFEKDFSKLEIVA